jgi:transposase
MVRNLKPSGYKRWDRRQSIEIETIGIDLGKTIFHLVGLNRAGEVVVRRKCSRPQLLRFTSNLHVRLVGMEASLPGVLEDADNCLSGLLRMLMMQLQGELRQLQNQIDNADALIASAAKGQEACQRLMAIPGIGPLTATAVVLQSATAQSFARGARLQRGWG